MQIFSSICNPVYESKLKTLPFLWLWPCDHSSLAFREPWAINTAVSWSLKTHRESPEHIYTISAALTAILGLSNTKPISLVYDRLAWNIFSGRSSGDLYFCVGVEYQELKSQYFTGNLTKIFSCFLVSAAGTQDCLHVSACVGVYVRLIFNSVSFLHQKKKTETNQWEGRVCEMGSF